MTSLLTVKVARKSRAVLLAPIGNLLEKAFLNHPGDEAPEISSGLAFSSQVSKKILGRHGTMS